MHTIDQIRCQNEIKRAEVGAKTKCVADFELASAAIDRRVKPPQNRGVSISFFVPVEPNFAAPLDFLGR
jgi:hypothetical protein